MDWPKKCCALFLESPEFIKKKRFGNTQHTEMAAKHAIMMMQTIIISAFKKNHHTLEVKKSKKVKLTLPSMPEESIQVYLS